MPHSRRTLTTASLLVSAAVALSGCSTAPSATERPPTPSSAVGPATGAANASPSSESPTLISITLAKGKVSPNGTRVNVSRGDRVTLTITSDRDDSVHVHGYDLDLPVTAGTTATESFIAAQTGRFEIESHHPSLVIVILQVS